MRELREIAEALERELELRLARLSDQRITEGSEEVYRFGAIMIFLSLVIFALGGILKSNLMAGTSIVSFALGVSFRLRPVWVGQWIVGVDKRKRN